MSPPSPGGAPTPKPPTDHISPRIWRDKLLSGDVERCMMTLGDGKRRCCLGVYRDLDGLDIPDSGKNLEGHAPSWLSWPMQNELINANDDGESGTGWEPDGLVIQIIDTQVIPAYDRWFEANS